MSVLKVIEILAESKDSWEAATQKAVEKASKSVDNVRSAYVQEMSTVVEDGKVSKFRVNVKITFEVK